ncbi:LysR family glycine cleavage system transcriptional activator [Ancylobacter sp. 3268]|uniref:LysR substrate-binding domain-containing protein n=1 Tax=Ancylobacter sp. 3268 TaxID=2817752 RepID=UPI0028667E58|nr:LysR substrate-binding domain-containing protein [Ancylobacter sp. 3268]MDR6954832.1 LysR family glycine cleavage system transcriptional activator [Ancylobacter sp. 3268]
MTPPYRSLPSLQALRCFEAAGRLGSFSLAAEEMCITHSAISHQIRGLEEAIGQPLFLRQGNRMALTEIGRTLAAETRRALDYLSHAYAVAHETAVPRPAVLNLAMQIGLMEHWLMPRLSEFTRRLDGVGLRIRSLADLSEACPDDVEVALVYGTGDVPGMISEKIAEEEVFPVCSPDFLARHPSIRLERMHEAPLLLHSRVTWNLWLERAGLPIVYPRQSIMLDDVALTVRGALAGQGIAMARSLLVRDYLADGTLVRLFELSVPGIFSYHLACRSHEIRERYREPLDWICTTIRVAARTPAALPPEAMS